MANVDRNIVETRKLASKGRFGDNMVREIDEAPAHVNAYEAYLVDRYGKAGERVVEDIGAGTVNPNTGMKEYHFSWGDPLNTHHNKDFYGASFRRDFTDPSPDVEKEKRVQAGDIVSGGMESLLKQQQQYLGPGGFLTREQELEEEGIAGTYAKSLKDITSEKDKLISGTNLAYSGEIEKKMSDLETEASGQYTSQMGLSGLKADKAETDFMAGIRKDMNRMLLEYQAAAGQTYKGGDALTELNQLFEEYGGGG